MTNKNYKPPMKPFIRPAGQITRTGHEPTPYPAQIVVSGPCWRDIRDSIPEADLDKVKNALVGNSICPENYYFSDTPEMRKILGVEIS